jgi:hypothetical protein
MHADKVPLPALMASHSRASGRVKLSSQRRCPSSSTVSCIYKLHPCRLAIEFDCCPPCQMITWRRRSGCNLQNRLVASHASICNSSRSDSDQIIQMIGTGTAALRVVGRPPYIGWLYFIRASAHLLAGNHKLHALCCSCCSCPRNCRCSHGCRGFLKSSCTATASGWQVNQEKHSMVDLRLRATIAAGVSYEHCMHIMKCMLNVTQRVLSRCCWASPLAQQTYVMQGHCHQQRYFCSKGIPNGAADER